MQRSWMITPALALLVLASTGCQNKIHDENLALHRQNQELQARLTDTENRLRQAPDPNQVQQMQQQLAARDAKIAELENQLRQPAPGQAPDNALAGIEVTRDDRAGTVTVNLPGDVLFDSGKAELKPSARTTLAKVVTAIKRDYPGKRVLVDGYTDSDPIRKTRDKWEDNLELSAARARSVRNFLVEQGLEPRLVTPRALSDSNPRGSKDKSRRVEVVVSAR